MAETLDLIDAAGASHSMSANTDGMSLLWGATGRFLPPISSTNDRIPGQPGARRRSTLHDSRTYEQPVLLRGATESDLRLKIRQWLGWLDPTRGPVTLRNTAPDATTRDLIGYYSGGLELDEAVGVKWGDSRGQRAVLTFEVLDPYWYDPADTTELFEQGTSTASWFPIFPLSMASSEVFGELTIVNDGDVLTWPVWTIGGPGSGIILRNPTTAKITDLNRPGRAVVLAAGESVTIDTRPGRKAVTRNDGSNLFPALTDLSSLWALARGSQTVRVEMGSATDDSYVALAYRRRFLGP